MAKTKRFDGYIRVSRVAGREGESFISPSEQRATIEKWASLRGVTIAEWHEDLDQSGGKLSRPGLDALMGRIRAGETDGLAVARLDRLSRAGVADALRLVEEVDACGASIAAVDLGIDPTTTFGEFALTIMLALGRMERRRITESWDAANRRAIERGVHFTGRTPYGYDREKGQPLTVNEATAPVVREIFERRAMKESRWSIAGWMNEAHPRTDGRQWTARNIEVIHSNRVYLGEAYHGKHRNPEAHPAIVTQAEFDAANAVKGGPGRTVRREGAMLAGLIRCAGCRYAMRNSYTHYGKGENRRKVRIYSCQGKHGSGKCQAPATVMAHLVEPIVLANVLAMTAGTEWADAAPDTDAQDAARRALDQAEAGRAAFLADDELRDVIGREAYLDEAKRRQQAVDDAQAEYDQVTRTVESVGRRTHTIQADWATWSRERRIETLRTVLDTVYVKKGRGDLERRVMILWDGEDQWERPKRGGHADFRMRPIEWPEGLGDAHAWDVPGLARELGSPVALDAHLILTGRDDEAEPKVVGNP